MLAVPAARFSGSLSQLAPRAPSSPASKIGIAHTRAPPAQVAIAAFRLALSNGWTLSELDPRKLFSKGDDAAPPAAVEAEPARLSP